MPTITANDKTFGTERTFDARPDRIDLRDRAYQPQLRSLPNVYPSQEFVDEHLSQYPGNMVLDQGAEGACTGFGLAATINFLLWRKNNFTLDGLTQVSPRMLYQLARVYDEWPGEDYSGSSCRGAMRGWHRHGVCNSEIWPYRNRTTKKVEFVTPADGWEEAAAQQPLGAYYRINKDSIADMQAAIHEVGAIYASASVHEGWFLGTTAGPQLIDYPRKMTGGHAFVIGGYNNEGFLVQNSWGPDWGYKGFAYLSYADWIDNGSDAWVAVLGAPMKNARASSAFSSESSADTQFGKTTLFGKGSELSEGFDYTNDKVRPASEEWAYKHSLVMGNNGLPINKLIATEHIDAALDEICLAQPKAFFDTLPANSTRRLAIYVHGGLNSEEASIKRVRALGPYFRENGIHPLFITWRSGLMESMEGVMTDSFRNAFQADSTMPDESFIDKVNEKMQDAKDRSIEVACEKLLVKPLWSEMKQNAESAALSGGGVLELVSRMIKLQKEVDDLEIHLIGHSAGSIVIGHMLSAIKKRLTVRSISLYAPACTLEFANRHYIKAVKQGVFKAGDLHVDNMDDERERADTVGPYGKSLLYLVSRALEVRHKTPILGLDCAWRTDKAPQDLWHDDNATDKSLKTWAAFADGDVKVKWHDKKREFVSTGPSQIRLAHGSFDNDVDVVEATLRRIRRSSLLAKVENLDY